MPHAYTPLPESTRMALLQGTAVPLLERCDAWLSDGPVRDAVRGVLSLYREGAGRDDPRWVAARDTAAAAEDVADDVAAADAAATAEAAAEAAAEAYTYDAAAYATGTAEAEAAERKRQALDLAAACLANGINLAPTPVGPRVLAAIESGGGRIEQGNWHTCETVHCHAGFLIHVADAYSVEAVFGSAWTGAAVAVAELPDEPLPDFRARADPDDVLDDVRRRAGLVTARAAG